VSDDDLPEVTPHDGVHRAVSFISGDFGCIVTLDARPAGDIAASLLEDVGDWMRALHTIPAGQQPPAAVMAAVDTLHTVVCDWTDWEHRRSNPPPGGRRDARASLGLPPDDAA
jgi:hypothetical protein